MKTLNPKIVEKLTRDLKVAPQTVKNNVSSLARKNPGASLNALAHVYAMQNGKSVLALLSKEDKQSFPAQNNMPISASAPISKNLRIIQIGKEPDRLYNNWLVQLLIAFFLVGIVAGTIAQVLGIFLAKKLGIN
jgi:hypothetical protein